MAIVISICNQKGGVGKTTTAVNISAYLALSGNRTLLVDIDPQGNATLSSGVLKQNSGRSLYEVISGNLNITQLIVKSVVPGMDVLPSSIDMAGADITISQIEKRELVLKNIFEPIKPNYDVIVFDCPPSLGLLTINALSTSNFVLIPVQLEYLALEGLNSLIQAIGFVKKGPNPELEIGGIIFTMADFRSNLSKEVADEVKRFFKNLVFESVIPRNVRLAESPSFGKPIALYDPHSSGAAAYQHLTQEISDRFLQGRICDMPINFQTVEMQHASDSAAG
jgi:chromosome partitioning protein